MIKKLTYWVAHDRNGYSTPDTIREKSKKKVQERLKQLTEEQQYYYCEPKRVFVFYDNPLDLLKQMSDESNCWWENHQNEVILMKAWLEENSSVNI